MHTKFAIHVFALTFAMAVAGCGSDNGNGGGTGGSTGTGGARTGGASGSGGAGTGGTSGGTGGAGTGGTTGTGGSGTGGSTDAGGGTGGAAGDTAAETGAETAASVKWTTDVKPIFAAKCMPCHTTGMMGGHSLGASYAMAKANATSCSGKTKGACTIDRIKAGTMPAGKGCTGNPAMDIAKPACLTAAEQATVQAWVTGGLLE